MDKILGAVVVVFLVYLLFLHNDGALIQQLAESGSRWFVRDVLRLPQQ